MRWILAVIGLAALIAWAGWVERDAQSKARAFCDRVELGSSFAQISEAAKTAGEVRLRIIEADSVMVGFTGIPPFSRHACKVLGNSGLVERKQYLHLD